MCDRSDAERARDRRRFELGKHQLHHRLLASLRVQADRLGHGKEGARGFALFMENDFGGGGRAHRKASTKELVDFMAQFVLVGQVDGYNTSQCCNRCGGRTEFAHPKREYRTKARLHRTLCCCTFRIRSHPRSRAQVCRKCPGYGYRDLYMDRDAMAAINIAQIVASEVRGEGRPERFQSRSHKKRGSRGGPPQASRSLVVQRTE